MKFYHHVFNCLSLVTLLAISRVSAAAAIDCNTYNLPPPVTQNIVINTGNITAQANAPVGTVLYDGRFGSKQVAYECIARITFQAYKNNSYRGGVISSYGNSVYNTNLAGVGLRLREDTEFTTPQYYQNPKNECIECYGSNAGGGGYYYYSHPIRVQIIKTGTITPGSLTASAVGTQTFTSNQSGSIVTTANITMSSSSRITQASCSITTPTVNVALGDFTTSSFPAVGTVLGAKNFNVGLNCTAGARVNVTLNATKNTDTSNNSIIALTGAGTAGVAKGIGVQILRNSAPLDIGSTLLVGTAVAGAQSFAFTARFYQTLPTVTSGNANATGTLDITYL